MRALPRHVLGNEIGHDHCAAHLVAGDDWHPTVHHDGFARRLDPADLLPAQHLFHECRVSAEALPRRDTRTSRAGQQLARLGKDLNPPDILGAAHVFKQFLQRPFAPVLSQTVRGDRRRQMAAVEQRLVRQMIVERIHHYE